MNKYEYCPVWNKESIDVLITGIHMSRGSVFNPPHNFPHLFLSAYSPFLITVNRKLKKEKKNNIPQELHTKPNYHSGASKNDYLFLKFI